MIKKVRRTKQTFLQRRHQNDQQKNTQMLNITNHQGNANQSHNEISPHVCQAGYHEEDRRQEHWKAHGKMEHLNIVGGNVNWSNHCGQEYGESSKN